MLRPHRALAAVLLLCSCSRESAPVPLAAVGAAALLPQQAEEAGPEALKRAAALTRERLTREAAAWNTRQSLQGDYEILSENVTRAGVSKRRLHTIDNAREATFVELLEREGAWEIAVPATAAGTHPAFAAHLEPPVLFAELHRSRLQLFAAELEAEVGEWKGVEEGEAIFRRGAPAGYVTAVEALLKSPDARVRERAQERLDSLQRGIEHRVRTGDGTLARIIAPGVDLAFEPLVWGAEPPAAAATQPQETDPAQQPSPTAGRTQNPTPPAAAPEQQPLLPATGSAGAGTHPAENLLLARCWGTDHRLACSADSVLSRLEDPASVHRIPARNATEPIAFLPDGRVLALADGMTGRRAIAVEPETGEATPIGAGPLEWGYSVTAALAPDGKRAVIGYEPVLESGRVQHLVVDLATNTSRPLGGPIDATAPSWSSEGDAVFVATQGPTPKILRLGLDGVTTELVEGTDPVPLDPKRLLLRRGDRWFVLELATKTLKPFGDGFRRCTRPAVSPERSELLFVCQDRFRFVLERVAASTPRRGKKLPLPPGRFERPALR